MSVGPRGRTDDFVQLAGIFVDQPIAGTEIAAAKVHLDFTRQRIDRFGGAVRIQPLPDRRQRFHRWRMRLIVAEEKVRDSVKCPKRRRVGVVAEAVALRDAVAFEEYPLSWQRLERVDRRDGSPRAGQRNAQRENHAPSGAFQSRTHWKIREKPPWTGGRRARQKRALMPALKPTPIFVLKNLMRPSSETSERGDVSNRL